MTTTEIAPYDVSNLPAERGGDSLVRPAADTSAIKASFRAYTELCEELLDASDYQTIGKKDFRKKSGWRKLAVAFGISCELVSEKETRNERGRIQRCKTVVRAVAPNGRYQDGVGVCDVYERCCPAAEGLACGDKRQYHRHCETGCPGWIHYSGAEHDIVATAFTRAQNRAEADLFGMGEVSAEEMNADGAQNRAEQSGGPDDSTADRPQFERFGYADKDEEASMNESLIEMMKRVPEDRRAAVGEEFDKRGYVQGHRFPVAKSDVADIRAVIVAAIDGREAPERPLEGSQSPVTVESRESQPEPVSEPQNGAEGSGDVAPEVYVDELDGVYRTVDSDGAVHGDLDRLTEHVSKMTAGEVGTAFERRGGDPFDPNDVARRGLIDMIVARHPVTAPEAAPAAGVALHRRLGALGIASAEHATIVRVASTGRTMHASELTGPEAEVAYGLGRSVSDGSTTIADLRDVADSLLAEAKPAPARTGGDEEPVTLDEVLNLALARDRRRRVVSTGRG